MDTKIELTNLTKKEVIKQNQENKENKIFNKFMQYLKGEKRDSATNDKNIDVNKQNNDKKSHKIFKNKQLKVAIIVLIFGIFALLILNSSFGSGLTSIEQSSSSETYISSFEYCEKLEKRLITILSCISGAGEVKVMVSVDNGPQLIVANSTDERVNTTTNGSTTTTTSTSISEPVIVKTSSSSTPLIVSETTPTITGVVVVASGAKDTKIRLNILEAVEALLDVSSNNIQIYY